MTAQILRKFVRFPNSRSGVGIKRGDQAQARPGPASAGQFRVWD